MKAIKITSDPRLLGIWLLFAVFKSIKMTEEDFLYDDDERDFDEDYDDSDDDYDDDPNYDDFDCTCGAWQWSKTEGRPIHVADCCCGSSEPWF